MTIQQIIRSFAPGSSAATGKTAARAFACLLMAGVATNRCLADTGPYLENSGPCVVTIKAMTDCPWSGTYYTLAPGQIVDLNTDHLNCDGYDLGWVNFVDLGGNPLGSIPSVQRSADGTSNQKFTINGCAGGQSPINDAQNRPPTPDDPCDHQRAMPGWNVAPAYVSLWIQDEPLWYQPSLGGEIGLDLAYKQREFTTGEDPTIFSFGKRWNCSWVSYVNLDANTNPVVLLPKGGQTPFSTPTNYLTNTRLTGDTTNGFTLSYPDGSSDAYTFIVTDGSGAFQKAFLTIHSDPQALKTTFNYATFNPTNPFVRLQTIVDPGGATNTLSYVSANDFSTNLVSTVTDPFGRSVTLVYDQLGRLTNLTDVGSISTAFAYDGSDRVTQMTTPYGPTSFSFTETNATQTAPNGRSILVTEPDGGNHLFLYQDSAAGVASSYSSSSVPSTAPLSNNFDTNHLDLRNTFHWGRAQYLALSTTNMASFTSADFLKAHMYHWLLSQTSTVGETLSVERQPSPDSAGTVEGQKVWYDYAGKTNRQYEGSQFLPLYTAFVLPDGTSRFTRTDRNTIGLVTTNVTTYSAGASVSTRTETFTYAGNGIDLVTVTNALAIQASSNLYNAYHQVLTNYNALGEITAYSYNANQQLSTVTIPSGLVTSNFYFTSGSSSNRLNSTIDYALISGSPVYYRTNSYTWANALVATRTDPMSLSLTYTWDNLQRLRRVDYPDGTYITNLYANLDLVQAIDRMKFTNSFGYDSVRRLIAATNANGSVTRYGYCSCGSLEAVTNAFGTAIQAVTQYFWDLQGHRIQTIGPDGYTLTQNFDALGRLTNSTDGLLSVTNWFNNQGLVVTSSNAYGQVSATIYDTLDRSTNFVDVNGVTLTNTFDNLNRFLTRGYPDGGVEKWVYTPNISAPTSYTNQLGFNVVNYIYDPLGRKTAETFPGVTTNQFAYDGPGHLVTLTDGKSQTTSWHYDQSGRATNKVDASGAEVFRYAYDPNDRLTNRWTPEKFNTAYQSDAVGNLTNIVYHASHGIALAYDLLDRLTTMVDAVGTTRYTYNTAGLLLTEDGPWPDDAVSYTYNSQRLRTGLSILAPNASPWVQTYGYDAAERLTNLTSPAGVFGYNLGGSGAASPLVRKLALANGAYITNNYDSVARLLSTVLKNSGNTVLDSHAYAYNFAGQRTAMTNTAGDFRNYAYDNIGQLTSALGSEADGTPRWQEQIRYAYDPAGNLSFHTNNELVETFNVNSLNELTSVSRTTNMTVVGTTSSIATNVIVNNLAAVLYADATFARTNVGLVNGTNTFTAIAADSLGRRDTNSAICNLPSATSYSYDQNGNPLNDGSRYFTYDDENQLISVVITNNGSVSTRSDFVYDGKMRRRIRVEYTWGGSSWVTNQVVRYVYDRNLPIQERDGDNLPTKGHTRGMDLSGSLQSAGGIGALLALSQLSTIGLQHFYYHADGNGNIMVLINTNQAVVAKYLYDPYSSILSQSGPLSDANLSRSSSMESHPISGLTSFLFRYYDANLRRWPNRDPIGEFGGINPYRYVGNNPIDLMDPFGLVWYNPFSWNWSQIGSAIEVKFGGELGLDVKAELSKFEGEIGAQYGMGGVWNLGGGKNGKSGAYNEARAGARVRCGKYGLHFGPEWEMQNFTNRDPDDERVYREEKSLPVWGIGTETAKMDTKDGWATMKLGATLVVVHGEVSVNFATIWRGITK